jgi:hypothetical protein
MAKLSLEGYTDKVIADSKLMQSRMWLTGPEEGRVGEAFALLANGPPPPHSKGAKIRETYLDFLRRIKLVVGQQGVVLSAASLGPSTVYGMKDRARVKLPHEMAKRRNEFENDLLQSLANDYSARGK